MSWQQEAELEMWEAIAEQDRDRERRLEENDAPTPATVRPSDVYGFGYELEPDRPTLPELLGDHDEAERRAVVAGYPWHVVGGTGRTVAAFRDEAGAERYAGNHPAFTVEKKEASA